MIKITKHPACYNKVLIQTYAVGQLSDMDIDNIPE